MIILVFRAWAFSAPCSFNDFVSPQKRIIRVSKNPNEYSCLASKNPVFLATFRNYFETQWKIADKKLD
ncbi:MAG: hypothetical protein CW691_04750 [Candidatus Bathyarchaeum sp.]|nr:MAG: hypothetical protein CW691_04750 [Candidatus Bathyarchaeum sp.]